MSAITSSRSKINLQETQTGAVDAVILAQHLGAVLNWIIDNVLNPPVGFIVAAAITEAEFTANKPSNTWVLCDGRNVSGSAYATRFGVATAPDWRGRTPRGKNNGRSDGKQNQDGELAVGASQGDNIKSHTHTPGNPQEGFANTNWNVGSLVGGFLGPPPNPAPTWDIMTLAEFALSQNSQSAGNRGVQVQLALSNLGITESTSESRVRSVTTNFFIRIN
jgi:hypothetical protein